MNDAKLTRRAFAAAAATGFAAIGLLGATVRSANAYQGNMERAVGSLHEALQSLQESTPNKGAVKGRWTWSGRLSPKRRPASPSPTSTVAGAADRIRDRRVP
jgi:hypothetical protein